MKIIVIHKAEFHKRPPVISVLYILLKLGYKPILITCGISESYRNELKDAGVLVYEYSSFKNISPISKIIDYYLFRRFVSSIFNKYTNVYSNQLLLWVEGAYTIVSLGRILFRFNYILQIQELHEKSRLQLSAIRKVIHKAKAVCMPEYNRTILYKVWFDLEHRPYVLPNKPYFLPTHDEMKELERKYDSQISTYQGKKIILYQGGIAPVRMLDKLALALKEINDDDYIMMLVGKESEKGYIESIKAIYPNVVHIDFLPAPDYLVFTTIAYLGYVCYKPSTLNNAYCAPNKINEFSAYSLPMIGNDIPGLKFIFESTGAGLIVDVDNYHNIAVGIKYIENHYDEYKANASKIYNQTDNVKTIETILSKIERDESK